MDYRESFWDKAAGYLVPLIFLGFILFPLIPFGDNSGSSSATDPATNFQDSYETGTYPSYDFDTDYDYDYDSSYGYDYSSSYDYDDYGLDESDGYYNVHDNWVPSPSYTDHGNASAICNDGTYSYSQNRRGTCSYHGGVSQWLY